MPALILETCLALFKPPHSPKLTQLRDSRHHMAVSGAMAAAGRLRCTGVADRSMRRRHCSATRAQGSTQLLPELQQLDTLLAQQGPEAQEQAVGLVQRLKEQGVVRGFGGAQQVPKRAYSLEELRLNKIEPTAFLSPVDSTLSGVRTTLQVSFLAGLTAVWLAQLADLSQIVQSVLVLAFLLTVDQVANAGGLEALLVDSAGRVLSSSYAQRVALHEAGHFLIAYLMGLLPQSYSLTSWDAFRQRRVLNVQAGTQFCDAAFQAEVASGKLSSSSLDTYSCVALAGVATEWLRFERAEGGVGDVAQLDALLAALRFSQAKADSQVRWAVLNVVTLLRRHAALHDRLAQAMREGRSVSHCISLIEQGLASVDAI